MDALVPQRAGLAWLAYEGNKESRQKKGNPALAALPLQEDQRARGSRVDLIRWI